MKLKFIQQDFQTDAVDAVCALFDGQQRRIGGDGLEPEYFTGIGAKCSCVICSDLQTPSLTATPGTTMINFVKPYRQLSS